MNGEILDLEDDIKLNKQQWHTIEIVVDRLVINEEIDELRSRLTDSLETALKLGNGLIRAPFIDSKKAHQKYG